LPKGVEDDGFIHIKKVMKNQYAAGGGDVREEYLPKIP
jgi:hypothetical protein